MKYDYSIDFKNTDFRKHPELYQIGRGEQGVLSVEPYKSEILPLWKFKTPDIAAKSSKAIYKKFLEYKKNEDFVGMDMARKFLQMGYTRSRRYANHPSGKKYSDEDKVDAIIPNKSEVPNYNEKNKKHFIVTKTKHILPQATDWNTSEKAESARIFYSVYLKAKENKKYLKLKKLHKETYKN